MMRSELQLLGELVANSGATNVLEIGMANGSSTVTILRALAKRGGKLTSIDPFQNAPLVPAPGGIPGYEGAGLRCVKEAGLAASHTLIEELDYLALPALVREKRRFDFILIDGYHSFDYTLVDFFFADLLLSPGGSLVFHDSGRLPVHRACQFVLHNKAYRFSGPPMALLHKSLARRLARRAGQIITGQHGRFKDRRDRWKSLALFIKEADGIADEVTLRGM